MRRKKHSELPLEQRLKANARAYSNVYKGRGHIEQKPCFDCGDAKSEMHHYDYDKPLMVAWLCKPCHRARHTEQPSINVPCGTLSLAGIRQKHFGRE